MILAAILVSLAQTNTLVLSRGGPGDASFRYWAVEDTFIDSGNPDSNYGRDALLSAGIGRTVLIRFGDLDRIVPPTKRVKSARMLIRIEIGKDPVLRNISRLLVPWGEGPDKRGFRLRPAPPQAKPMGPLWSATWKHRRAGENALSWQQAGAAGAADEAPITDAVPSIEGDWVVISNLGETVQRMVDRPYENFGFALRFDTTVDLTSSDNTVGRPRLELELEDAPARSGPDLSVTKIVWDWNEPDRWPASGQEITWTAVVKNVGNAPSEGFNARWSVRERPHSDQMISKTLAPGETASVVVTLPWRPAPDPRTVPLTFRIDPTGPDADPRNNGLTVSTAALALSLELPPQAAEEATRLGFASVDDWAQSVFRFWNESALPESRFSFAPEGALERMRLQSIDGGPAQFQASVNSNQLSLRQALIRLSRAIGLPDWSVLMHRPTGSPLLVDGIEVHRGTSDLFPGLLGGGDTRDESLFLPTLSMVYEPWVDPLIDAQPMPSTDLYSSADVEILNKSIGKLGGAREDWSAFFPRTPLVRVMDAGMRPLVGMTLDFYPVLDGKVQPAAFQVKTNAQGVAALPAREGGTPFGALDRDWSQGLYLVRTSAHGLTEWTWLKAWQLVAEYARGSALLSMRFAIPASPIESETNLMKNRVVTTSTDLLPAQLAPLVDDSIETAAEIELKADGWIEIDLGRDRPLGEVRLVLPDGSIAWPKFDVFVYATGQRASEARLWAQERDGAWTVVNRRDVDKKEPGVVSVAYRGPLTRARFVRIVVRESAGPAKIAEIRAAPLTFDAGGS